MKEICNVLDENNYYSEYYNKDKSYLINNPEYTVDLLDDLYSQLRDIIYALLLKIYCSLDIYLNTSNDYEEFIQYCIIKDIVFDDCTIFIESNYDTIKDIDANMTNKEKFNYNHDYNIIELVGKRKIINILNSNAKYEFTRKYINMEK